MQLQQQKQLELELRQARGGVGGVVGGSSADSIREVVNAAISLEFQRQRDRDYNSRQVGHWDLIAVPNQCQVITIRPYAVFLRR